LQQSNISLFIDGVLAVRLNNYYIGAYERHEGGPLIAGVTICFNTPLITNQNAYRLEFTNERGEVYRYRWGNAEPFRPYPHLWE
jgi:hypothetical protein